MTEEESVMFHTNLMLDGMALIFFKVDGNEIKSEVVDRHKYEDLIQALEFNLKNRREP